MLITQKTKDLTHLLENLIKREDRFVLVLSGGGTRGFYTLGVLKALEEFGYRERIDAVYGISVGSIIGAYWTAGYAAQEIYDKFCNLDISPTKRISLHPKHYLLRTEVLEKKFHEDLPETYEELEIPLYIGATDLNTAKLIMFNHGELIPTVLGSMAIPGIFPTVPYEKYLLVDGGVVDNFPTTTAKRQYPNHKIIGIALNVFKKNKKISNIFNTLVTSFEIMLRKEQVKRSETIDLSFYEPIDCSILEIKQKKWEKAFEQGYKTGVKKLSQLAEKH